MMLRAFALGVWRGKHSYMANGYNRLDVLIIVTSWYDLLPCLKAGLESDIVCGQGT